ncbi:MAG: IS256 family transposase [Phycisphaerae bacterium]|nr:IS256 family transposase [Phycisphaerae bacterium]
MDRLSVPPTRRQRQEAFWGWIDARVKQLVQDVAEQTLELEMQAYLQAAWNQRTPTRRGYRNGHYRRGLATPHGPLSVRIPRCRFGGLDCWRLFDRYQRRIADVDRILRHAYLLGVSTRGTAELAEQVFGGRLSHQTVSQLMRWLDEQLALWRQQPILPVYPVLYIDGMHVDVLGGDRMVMLAAGQRPDGQLDMLGFCVSTGEHCLELLNDLRRRGLEGVELFVSDESGAIRSALEQVYPEVAWQHCTFHRLAALRANVGPADFRDRMVAEAACVFRCPSRPAAVETAAAWARRWKSQAPWAVQQFLTDLQDSLRFYNLPKDWWRRVRTNNPLERQIRTLRQRLRPMGCFHDASAIERAVFGQFLRWHLIPELTHDT